MKPSSKEDPIHCVDFDSLTRYADDVPSWVDQYRTQQKQLAQTIGWPHRRSEQWRYTSLRSLKEKQFQWSQSKGFLNKEALSPFLDGSPCLVILDGVYDAYLSEEISPTPLKGMRVLSLKKALQDPDALPKIKQALEQKNPATIGFDSLREAFLYHGFFLHCPEAMAQSTLNIFYVNAAKNHPYCLFPQTFIHLDSEAELHLRVFHLGAQDADYWFHGASHLHLSPRSQLTLESFQQESPLSCHFHTLSAQIERDARLKHWHLGAGSQLARQTSLIHLKAPGSEVVSTALNITRAKNQLETFALIHHESEETQSRQECKNILADQSRQVFSGTIKVSPGAKGTKALQQNHNLLLSKEAEIDTKPQLEIDHDDVKCSHGATIGQMNDDQLFYLQSRGIAQADGRALLAKAFASELVLEIKDSFSQSLAQQFLEEWLHGS